MFDPRRDRNLQSYRFFGVIFRWYLCRLLLLACLPGIVNAQPTPTRQANEIVSPAPIDNVKDRLSARFAGAAVRGLRPAAFPGAWEAMINGRLVYFDAQVNYLFDGRLIDASTGRDLSEPYRQELARISPNDLPLSDALKTVRGNGKRVLYLFSDPDCPYCKQFEKTLAQLNNVTIYTFLFPIDDLHPQAARRAINVWCSPEREHAWAELMLRGNPIVATKPCAHPVARNKGLGQSLGVSATPTYFFADGSMGMGAQTSAQLEDRFIAAER